MEQRPPGTDQGLFNRLKSEPEGWKNRDCGACRIIPVKTTHNKSKGPIMGLNEATGGFSNTDSLFRGLSYPIRGDLMEQCQLSWQRLAQPGEWWTGAERIAMIREVRSASSCDICKQRIESLSPYASKELHAGNETLTPRVVDTVHRVATDAGRLIREWFDELRQDGVTDGQIVELIAITSTAVAINRLARGLGSSPPELQKSVSGLPKEKPPKGAAVSFAWVPTVPVEMAEDDLAELYNVLVGPDGNIPYVLQALSYVPSELIALCQLYQALYLPPGSISDSRADAGRAISRAQMEWIATTVSEANGCFY